MFYQAFFFISHLFLVRDYAFFSRLSTLHFSSSIHVKFLCSTVHVAGLYFEYPVLNYPATAFLFTPVVKRGFIRFTPGAFGQQPFTTTLPECPLAATL